MYGVVEDPKYKAAWKTGPEYQFIDDVGFPQKLEDWQKAGANYAMHLPNDQKQLKPVGEWNSTRIVVNGTHVEHWLNGKKILEFERWNDAWKKLRDSGKWKDAPGLRLGRHRPHRAPGPRQRVLVPQRQAAAAALGSAPAAGRASRP